MQTTLIFLGGAVFGAVVFAFLLRRTVRRELMGPPIPRQRKSPPPPERRRRHADIDRPPGFNPLRWFIRWW